MRAIIITPSDQAVQEQDINTSLEALQAIVGGDIECACELPGGDTLYVNENGLFSFRNYFDIGAHQPFAGPGVIVGPEGGDGRPQDARSDLEAVRQKVRFLVAGEE